ncbi:uncharacterized protein LOC129238832, partial [Anastrepha obliqua]|uniref:uncharacterized protein LOC129238832 n=1 Tax=Anastrepha obliqua TaxID=95512 RepID=UPI0024098DF3
MAWGVGSVHLRLKKRNPTDDNQNTLAAGEVEKDLGIEEIMEASLNIQEVEKGDLEVVSNPEKVLKPDAESPSDKPPQNICSYIDNNLSSDDLTVVALEGCKDETLLFGSCYMPHDGEAPQTELRKLVETAARKKHALVVGTDANAHHTVWGSADINDRGESLFTYILQSSLEIANRGEEPTYVGPTSKNVLDLTLYTSRHVMVQEWEVLSRPSFSDHRYISFQVIFRSKNKITSFRNPKNMNWD